MIRRYNRSQTIKAAFLAMGGLFCCLLPYGFFGYLPSVLAKVYGYPLPEGVFIGSGIAGVAAAWVSGYGRWKAGGGLFSYHESGLYHDLDPVSGGTVFMDHYAHRITGPAYVLGQVFMAGPLGLLKARTLLHSRIKGSAELETRLVNTLATLRAASKWQGMGEHPNARAEILYLAQMGLIDFSAHKGAPRFKAR